MRNNRSRVYVKNKKRRRRVRRLTVIGIFLIMLGSFLILRGEQNGVIVNSVTAGTAQKVEENEVQDEDIYYTHEVGTVESVLTETNKIVYSLHYPKFKQENIDQDIYELIKQMLTKGETADITVDHPDQRGMLYMNYDSYLVGNNIVSVTFYVEFNSIRMANPETIMISKHYDLNSGKYLTDDELFHGNYIEAIADYCKEQIEQDDTLKELYESGELDDRLEAVAANYQNLSLMNDGVLVTFSREQISSGGKEYQIKVPYKKLKKYLNFDYKSDTIVVEKKEEPVIEETKVPAIDPTKPMIALTFDDGPNPKVTNKILDILKKNNSRATFFVLGNRLSNHESTLERIEKEHSEIGSHTYNHKSLNLLSKKEIRKEVSGVNTGLEKILGHGTSLLRPPYGAINDTVRSTVNAPMIYWSVDTEDWKSRNKDAIVKQVVGKVKDGDIVLFHDLYDSTADAVSVIVPKLIEQGYQIVTVSEMFEAKQIALEPGKVYYSAR